MYELRGASYFSSTTAIVRLLYMNFVSIFFGLFGKTFLHSFEICSQDFLYLFCCVWSQVTQSFITWIAIVLLFLQFCFYMVFYDFLFRFNQLLEWTFRFTLKWTRTILKHVVGVTTFFFLVFVSFWSIYFCKTFLSYFDFWSVCVIWT